MRYGEKVMVGIIIITIFIWSKILIPQIHMDNEAWFFLSFMVWLFLLLFGGLFIGAYLTDGDFHDAKPYSELIVALFLLIPYSSIFIVSLWWLAVHFGVI